MVAWWKRHWITMVMSSDRELGLSMQFKELLRSNYRSISRGINRVNLEC